MNIKSLLTVTALIEGATGVALLVVPSVIVELLLGAGLSSPQSFVLGRIAGAALVSIGVACWLARRADAVVTGLVAGMLIYNVAVPVLLIYAAMADGMQGVALWPASILHVMLAVWCLLCLRPR